MAPESIWQTVETLMAAESAEALFSLICTRATEIGFDNVGFALLTNARTKALGLSSLLVQHSYLNDWAMSYQRLKNAQAADSDARVLMSLLDLPALAWNVRGQISLPALKLHIPEADRQISLASAFGIRGGLTLPINGRNIAWGFFTFSSDSNVELAAMEQCIGELHMLSSVAAARIMKIASVAKHAYPDAQPKPLALAAGDVILSTREAEVLRWCAAGKTSWEIAEILHISERTVNFHLSKIAGRFGVKGRLAACAVAISSRLIAL